MFDFLFCCCRVFTFMSKTHYFVTKVCNSFYDVNLFSILNISQDLWPIIRVTKRVYSYRPSIFNHLYNTSTVITTNGHTKNCLLTVSAVRKSPENLGISRLRNDIVNYIHYLVTHLRGAARRIKSMSHTKHGWAHSSNTVYSDIQGLTGTSIGLQPCMWISWYQFYSNVARVCKTIARI